MLAPEVEKFDPPKIITGSEKIEMNNLAKKIYENTFYRNVIVTIPDEIQIPSAVREFLLENNDYYKISKCSLTEFLEPGFIEYFVKKGKLHCLSADRNCVVENCAAITPEGVLSLHLLKFIYETLGIQGTKRNYGFYEVNLDLKTLKKDTIGKLKKSPIIEELFSFHLIWEPDSEDICPSSIAKYFSDKGVLVSVCSAEVKFLNPHVSQVPDIEDMDEIVEWIGMLCHNISMEPRHNYISTYEEPVTKNPLETNKISLLITKGFFTPTTILKACKSLENYVLTREICNYWACLSYQSSDNCPWLLNSSSPKMFLALDCCNSVFFTPKSIFKHTIGQLKYT